MYYEINSLKNQSWNISENRMQMHNSPSAPFSNTSFMKCFDIAIMYTETNIKQIICLKTQTKVE